MKRFKFSLESVLTVREKALTDERTILAEMLNSYNEKVNLLNEMMQQANDLKSQSDKYLQDNNFNPIIVSNYSMYGKKMQENIRIQEELIKNAKKEILKQQEKVKDAYIKVKSLEKLHDKQKEQYLKELQKEEIKETDDIVNSRNIA